jgi:antirestriction protein ArdC
MTANAESRASYEFNAAQTEGYTPAAMPEPHGPIGRIEAADRFLTNTGVRIERGGERAYYRPSTDTIHMPHEGLFTGTATMNRSEAWYAVALHETTHASGAPHRLNRQFGKRYGDQQYVDHAQYLAHWLKLLKEDDRAIFTAAAKASEAVAYLKGLQPIGPEPGPPGRRGPRSDPGEPQPG